MRSCHKDESNRIFHCANSKLDKARYFILSVIVQSFDYWNLCNFFKIVSSMLKHVSHSGIKINLKVDFGIICDVWIFDIVCDGKVVVYFF